MKKDRQISLFSTVSPSEISFTTISVFMRCQLEYWHRFIEKNKFYQPQGEEILQGRLLHKAAEIYVKRPAAYRNSEEVIEEIISKYEMYNMIKKKDIIIDAIRAFDQSPLRMLKNAQIEVPFKTRVKDYIFKGRVDCLASTSTECLILDFKRDKNELKHLKNIDTYLQVIFYYLGLQMDGFIRSKGCKIGYYFFLEGQVDLVEITPVILERGLLRIIEVISEMTSTQDFFPKRNALCNSCVLSKRKVCPKFKE